MKPKLILKSLFDIPANVLTRAVSMPGRAVTTSRQVLGPAVGATRREINAARHRSAVFARDIFDRARAPILPTTPWQRGGLNE